MQRTKRGRQAWFGFDLDGTLAVHEEGASIDHVGAPIPAMIERLKQHVEEGYDVRIVTARVCRTQSNDDRDYQLGIIQEWCREHLGFVPDVTNEKDFAMVALYDDRAFGVIRNTGKLEAAEIDDIYNDLFWVVPEAHDENGAEMTARRKIQVLARSHVDLAAMREYDEKYGVDGDAYAALEEELVREPAGDVDRDRVEGGPENPITVRMSLGCGKGVTRDFYVSPREARCLAASLLREADEADAAIERFNTTGWT